MSSEFACRIIDEIADNHLTRFLSFHLMGEPFLHKDLCALTGYAESRGIRVRLLTNGSLLETKRNQGLFEANLSRPGNRFSNPQRHRIQPAAQLSLDGDTVQGITEKPRHDYAINAGIYCVRSAALEFVPDGVFFTMPELMHRLMAANRKVGAYYIKDCWIGIESIEHFEDAIKELSNAPAEVFSARAPEPCGVFLPQPPEHSGKRREVS